MNRFERDRSLKSIREIQQRRMMGGRQYIGPKVKNDFKAAGISNHWNHNGTKLKNAFPSPAPKNKDWQEVQSRKYKDLDIRVRNTAPAAASTSSNGLTISRINNISRRPEASPLRPIVQNQQIIRTNRDETQHVTLCQIASTWTVGFQFSL